MNKPLHFLLCVALLFLSSQSFKTGNLFAQTPVLIPNPDAVEGNGRGYGLYAFAPTPVEFNNALYSLYTDVNSKIRLSVFDGTNITLLPNPDNGSGLAGTLVVFNNAIYGQYRDENSVNRLFKYDGNNLVLLPNPENPAPSGVDLGFTQLSFFVVYNNALYTRYYQANKTYRLVKVASPAPTSQPFGITGVTGVNCTALSANQRKLIFTPQYTGLTGQPVSFSVVNELQPTNNAGPYSLTLYTDNPTINLKATQTGTPGEASYSFNWLASCGSARRSATELQPELSVTVMPNPGTGPTVDVLVEGATGGSITFQVVDERGKPVSQLRIEQSTATERGSVRLGSSPGIYFLKVNTPTQVKTVKVVRK